MPISHYRLAQQHYARLRRLAYDSVVQDAVHAGGIRVPLRLADTDEETVAVWRTAWKEPHPTGYGGWDWADILNRAWRRPSAFHVAVWSGEQLCGLGVGRLSKRRLMGARHTISVNFVESAHTRDHPLRHMIAPLVISAAEVYGGLVGASRVRLIEPLPGVIRLYVDLGYTVAWKAGQPVYCERRI